MILVLSIIVGIPPYKHFDKALAWKLLRVELSQHCVNFSTNIWNSLILFLFWNKNRYAIQVSNIKRFKLLLRKNDSFWLKTTCVQHHVIREKKLSEREALSIFYNVVCVVNKLHEKNVIHRDLKLGNIVLNCRYVHHVKPRHTTWFFN